MQHWNQNIKISVNGRRSVKVSKKCRLLKITNDGGNKKDISQQDKLNIKIFNEKIISDIKWYMYGSTEKAC